MNWVAVVITGAEERVKRGKGGRHQAALFYTDNGMVAFIRDTRLFEYLL